ncbi:hypothetical protein GHC20_08660 [Brucella sp. 2280]|nr:hypothetical protein GHC20_08660 [Brucella sp. 2280]
MIQKAPEIRGFFCTFGLKMLYFFVFTHYPTQNCFTLLLEMLQPKPGERSSSGSDIIHRDASCCNRHLRVFYRPF